MRTESKHVQTALVSKCAPLNIQQQYGNVNGTTIPIVQNIKDSNIDSFKKNVNNNLTPTEQQQYENIYKKIYNICNDQNINIKLAMSFGLLEKIAGVSTKAELIQLDENTINELVQILNSSLGWGDGLGFGEKDTNDLIKLTDDIHKKIAYEKTGGSELGQIWHNFKNGIKSFFGGNTIKNCQNENEVSSYYQEKYLKNIEVVWDELFPKEQVKIVRTIIKQIFISENNLKIIFNNNIIL